MSGGLLQDGGEQCSGDTARNQLFLAGMEDRTKAAATMAEIARIAGVSVSTVSRALSGSTLVASAKREEILRLARDSGYAVHPKARQLRLKRTQTLGIIIPLGHESAQSLTDPFLSQLLLQLVEEITLRGYGVLLQKLLSPAPDWLAQLVSSGRADGFIVVGQSDEREVLQAVAEVYLPLVVWGGRWEGDRYCTVGTDHRAGGRAVTRHLIDRGRRQLVFLGSRRPPEIGLRYAGYVEALNEASQSLAGLAPPRAVETRLTMNGADDAVRELIASGVTFDALVCATDVIAFGALRALAAAGRTVPGEVAVTGYDDLPLASKANPPLTTIRQDVALAAATMVERLFRRMDGHDLPSVTLPTELVVRESSGDVG